MLCHHHGEKHVFPLITIFYHFLPLVKVVAITKCTNAMAHDEANIPIAE